MISHMRQKKITLLLTLSHIVPESFTHQVITHTREKTVHCYSHPVIHYQSRSPDDLTREREDSSIVTHTQSYITRVLHQVITHTRDKTVTLLLTPSHSVPESITRWSDTWERRQQHCYSHPVIHYQSPSPGDPTHAREDSSIVIHTQLYSTTVLNQMISHTREKTLTLLLTSSHTVPQSFTRWSHTWEKTMTLLHTPNHTLQESFTDFIH